MKTIDFVTKTDSRLFKCDLKAAKQCIQEYVYRYSGIAKRRETKAALKRQAIARALDMKGTMHRGYLITDVTVSDDGKQVQIIGVYQDEGSDKTGKEQ